MLVRAFKVEIGQTIIRPIRPIAQHKSMRRTAVKPNVQNIEHLRVVFGRDNAAQETLFRALLIPSIRPLGLKSRQYTGIHLFIPQQIIFIRGQAASLGETG